MAKPGEKYVGSSWFFRFRYRWQRSIERLTDAEAGRLVKAMLYYSMTGAETDLPGKESATMTALLDDLDEDKAEAAYRSEIGRRNVSNRYARPDGTAAPGGYNGIQPYTAVLNKGTGKDGIPPAVPRSGGRGKGRRSSSAYTEEDLKRMEANEVDLNGGDPAKEEQHE